MHNRDYTSAKIGEFLPELKLEPISRTILALYAGASGDHNPLHIDTDYANEIGLPDVIAHGMLIMGYLGRVLTNNFNQDFRANNDKIQRELGLNFRPFKQTIIESFQSLIDQKII